MGVGTPALVVLALWWACETAFRPAARRRFGHELTDGYPRWRVALGCLTQIVSFPAMFLAFALGRQPWLMESFLLVFACSLLQDCARFPKTMGPLLLLHHAACLVGLLVARFGAGPEWRSVFPYFHCGCTALELGSGACNVHCCVGKQRCPETSASWLSGGLSQRQITPQAAPSFGQPRPISRWVHAGHPNPNPNQVYWLRWLPPKKSELLYHLAMTGSNVVAVACVGVWVVHAQAHPATRFFAAAAIAVLVFLRQQESNEHCRVSRWRSPLPTLTLPHSDDTLPFE